ncbi:MAG: antitoxin family protein [Acidobacteria bacterium]|jgi:predicted DNA-binding antitoxin AbrB/MazE fold protein|nr:antitoxin family protein [Acidobacteriota bacterium]
MTIELEAIYQGGVLRPLEPLDLSENQRVRVKVSDLDEDELLDTEYLRYCEAHADESISLEEVRVALSKIPGAMTADFIAEREDRF